MPGPMPNPTIPSNAPRNGAGSSAPSASENSGPVRVKQEPNYDAHSYQTNGLPPNYGNNIARERAAQQLQQKFGNDAQSQINRLQAHSTANMPQQPQRNPAAGQYQQPGSLSEKQRAEMAEHQRQAVQSQTGPRPPGLPQQPVANNARTDGADDWDEFVSVRRQAAEDHEAQHVADLTIRQQYEQMQRANEGGGLLLPVSEQVRKPQPKKRRAAPEPTGASVISGPSKIPQLDGIDDEEDSKADIKDDLFDGDEDDADAINSDLDDPDDNAIEEEQDEGRPNHIMLCTYDKVQRVKNKWKCTLKDGVLNTGGKE